MASQSEVLVGAPLTVRNVDIAQEPLFAIDLPRGLYSLIHFQGTVSGRVSGTSHVNLNVLQITVPFHGELWSMYTFNGGRFDSFPPYRSAGEEVHTAGFTDIRSSGYHFYDLCPEMRRFHAGMVDRTGEYCHYDVWPFDQRQYYVSVHTCWPSYILAHSSANASPPGNLHGQRNYILLPSLLAGYR